MSRWGRRWSYVPGVQEPTVAGSCRVGGRYVPVRRRVWQFKGIRMKNRYEQNYAAFLTFLGLDWQYEPRKFIFEKIQSGVRVFTPDFYLPHAQEFHETKGYMDRRSATQIRRLKKYYPEVTLIVVDSRFFKDAERQRLCRVIPEWVCPHTEPR